MVTKQSILSQLAIISSATACHVLAESESVIEG
jgi:hypothetical protein